MKDYMEILTKTPLFRGLNDSEIEKILPLFKTGIRQYRKGEYILKAGKNDAYLGIMLSGKAHIIQEEFWGNRNIVSTIGKGMNFGESYACAPEVEMSISVVAEADCRVMFLHLREGLQYHRGYEKEINCVTMNLIQDMAYKNIYFTEKLRHIGERTTRTKIISYLSAQSEKTGRKQFDIPFTRQELADYLFVDRSGLSAELCKMRDEGLLEFHRNHFILKN